MASVWDELRRRNVFKVGAVYVVVAWLLIQVADIVLPTFSALEAVGQPVTFVLILGFPVAVILAWAYQVTPHGIQLTKHVPLAESIAHITGQKLNNFVTGLLVLVVAFLVVDDYLTEDVAQMATEESSAAVETATVVLGPAEEDSASDVLPNSVAVIPFENMSADPENAFFAAGIHDEIINQLAKLKSLNVIARTSVMQYAGAARPITEIARELNVGTVMEGSVSYAENRVAVRAQLIDAETGVHLWSESYNRDFSDVFGIQADIAMNVANALEAEFSLEEQASIEEIPTESLEAYRFYLAADDLNLSSDWNLALELLDRAIEADPDFVLAYGERAWVRAQVPTFGTGSQAEFEARVEEMERLAFADIDTVLELDPNMAWAHLAAGYIHSQHWRGALAQEAFARAFELSPNNPQVLSNYAAFKSWIGHHEEAVRLAERRNELDPMGGGVGGRFGLARILTRAEESERSIAIYRDLLETNPGNFEVNRELAYYEVANGNSARGKAHLEVLERQNLNSNILARISAVASHYARLGFDEDAARVLKLFEERAANRRVSTVARLWEHLARGDEDQALYSLERIADEQEPYDGVQMISSLKQNFGGIPMLNQPEFIAVRERIGFTDL